MPRAFRAALLTIPFTLTGIFLSGVVPSATADGEPARPESAATDVPKAGGAKSEPAKVGDPKTIQIGLMGSLFRDLPTPLAAAVAQPLSTFMEAQTGIRGEIQTVPNAGTLGRLLAENKVQLAVFHGFEFAWARTRHPQLQPLVIAVNRQQHLKAVLVVRRDRPVSSVKALAKQPVALPRNSREHSRMFLDRLCEECGRPAAQFFSEVTTPGSIEDALDDVVDDVVRATVVDGVSLDAYKARKPARFAQLNQVRESCVFPAAVVAYHPGGMDETWVRRFKECLMNAPQGLMGRQLMVMWNLTSLEAVPADYEQILCDFVKVFPPPAGAGSD